MKPMRDTADQFLQNTKVGALAVAYFDFVSLVQFILNFLCYNIDYIQITNHNLKLTIYNVIMKNETFSVLIIPSFFNLCNRIKFY